MLRVRIAPLPDGLHTESLSPEPSELELSAEDFSDLAVEVQLAVSERQIVASFEVSATAHFVCDRTDEPFDQTVRGSHTVLIVAPDAPVAGSDDDDVIVTADDVSFADLTVPVRDTLLLAVPVRRVSPAAEALEIPTAFGGPEGDDDPADDRWAALKALRSDDTDDS